MEANVQRVMAIGADTERELIVKYLRSKDYAGKTMREVEQLTNEIERKEHRGNTQG